MQTTEELETKILVIACSPHDQAMLNLSAEIRALREAIDWAIRNSGAKVELEILTDLNLFELSNHIKSERPTIVHLTGHGAENGSMVLQHSGGNSEIIPPKVFAEFLERHRDGVFCFYLSACCSSVVCNELRGRVNSAIGFPSKVNEDLANAYVKWFYNSLLKCESLRSAFDTFSTVGGKAEIDESMQPKLYVNKASDASLMFLPSCKKKTL